MTTITTHDVTRLFRPELANMQPYVPIHPFEVVSRRLGMPAEQIVKLDANENPYGPSPRAIEAMATYRWHHIYPDPQSIELREALAASLGVPADRILAGQGADELIDLVGRLFLAPGDAIIDCPPTFGMYAFCAAVNGACVINVPRRADFSIDVAAIERVAAPASDGGYDDTAWLDSVQVDCGQPNEIDASAASPFNLPRPKLLFLCSPNNPDGGLVSPGDLERLLRLPIVVVLDQAYVEFAGPEASFVDWVAKYPNLIVLRTFSKWAGLGGLRVGYGIFPPAIIEQLWKIKPPYNVNVAGAQAALASLADRDNLMGNVTRLDRGARASLRRVGTLQLSAASARQPGEFHPLPACWAATRANSSWPWSSRVCWCATSPSRVWRTASGSRPAGQKTPNGCSRRFVHIAQM